MNLIQPKPYIDKMFVRHQSYGPERRRNMMKMVVEKGTPIPKPVTYEDIDQAFYDWVDKTLDISYDNKRLPTYKLFSNQRISEYAQTWSNLDETGNILLNFKTITRENNPKKGNILGGMTSVPGDRDYTMFYVPVLQENGTEAYDLYKMKLPTMVDFKYTISLVTNKYALLNRMNEMVQYQFKSIQVYLFPQAHAMSMVLDEIGDESEYSIDDRKYYAQTYSITLRGYIIPKEYFSVSRVPSRLNWRVFMGNRYRKGQQPRDLNPFVGLRPSGTTKEEEFEDAPIYGCEEIIEESPVFNKIVKVVVNFTLKDKEVTFNLDTHAIIETFELENVYDYRIFINGEVKNTEESIEIKPGDEIKVKVSRDDDFKEAKFTLIGYNPDVFLNKNDNPESILDYQEIEEIIEVNVESTCEDE